MKDQYILGNVPYNTLDVRLGTLVPDMRHPNQDTLTVREAKEDVDYSPRHVTDFAGMLDEKKESSWTAQLTALFGMSRSKKSEDNIDVHASKKVLSELKRPKEFFNLVCAEPKARKWLQEGLEQGDASYFVVGIITLLDATADKSASASISTTVESQVKAGEVVKANTGIDPGSNLDGAVEGKTEESEASKENWKTEGERIYGLCYRRIKMSKRKPISDKVLGDNMWRLYSDQRDSTSGNQVEEVYEVSLEEFDLTDNDGMVKLGKMAVGAPAAEEYDVYGVQ